ncbi:MAG: saccharopine dehydrogenase family protein [Gemmatimonadales bacterium]
MKMLVLGAGLQGSACAYDLCRHDAVASVTIADHHSPSLPPFLQPHQGGKLATAVVDVKETAALKALMAGHDAVMSAIPYYYNESVARAAVEVGLHFSDLGGNTEIVFAQKKLQDAAAAKRVSVVPDCGLAPGMVNILAAEGIRRLDRVDRVKIYVGGLPQHPEPPLNYQVVYSLEGALDYYTTPSWVLRDGKRAEVEALTEIEQVDFPAPVGGLEAFHTAGGISTMPWAWEGKVPVMEYKTLRYPGHAYIMKAIRDLGLIDARPIEVKGTRVVPRDVFIAAVMPHLHKPEGRDLVALRVDVSGTKAGKPLRTSFQLIDFYDAERKISAMMRTTGYSLAITGVMQVDGRIGTPGVHTPDEAVPFGEYVRELGERGVEIREVG